MNIKDKVLHLVQRELSNANDDLFRTRHKFQDFGQAQMNTQYGYSGDTCQEALDGCINKAADLQLKLDWVRSRED